MRTDRRFALGTDQLVCLESLSAEELAALEQEFAALRERSKPAWTRDRQTTASE